MNDPFGNRHSTLWVPYADFLAGILVIFLVVAALMLAHLNEPAKKNEADIKSPGSISIIASWKEDVDVDLWTKSPNDIPVGYSRKQGIYLNLLRDDLGLKVDKTAVGHFENVFSRNTPAGEYIVNLHMYMNRAKVPFPIKVQVDVELTNNTDGKNSDKTVVTTVADLVKEGQELTVLRFRIGTDGKLIEDLINPPQMPLREAK